MTTHHHHDWVCTACTLLTLPDTQQFADRVMAWACRTCPVVAEITGTIRVGTPVHTPDYWDHLSAQEQRQRTPEAQQATREQRAGRGW